MTLSVRSPDELIAVIPHLLGFKLFWTSDSGARCERALRALGVRSASSCVPVTSPWVAARGAPAASSTLVADASQRRSTSSSPDGT